MSDPTQLLQAISDGDPRAAEQLLPLVYQELRKLAAAKLSQEKSGQTLQPTALVHEAYLRLIGPDDQVQWSGRGHFFAAAAEAMRRILVENARRKKSARHGGHLKRQQMFDAKAIDQQPAQHLLDVNSALDKLLKEQPVVGNLVKLRFFAGLTNEQAALALDISPRTAKRYWVYAKAWLRHEIEAQE
ncbi:MAG: ECF-type sigma factor [bacterium]|nr:ECF-type sigma factor [bacterium]